MHQEDTVQGYQEQQEEAQEQLFQELTVKELEDRLELFDSCICRIGD